MELEYLKMRYSVSLQRAADARCRTSRRSHEGLAGFYAKRISEERRSRCEPAE